MHRQKINPSQFTPCQGRGRTAFTLVELIVVITILAILWTIAFISLSWYSEDARDSTRISDLSAIKTSLELFELDAGKYPKPTNGIEITYSWAVVWTQWTIWETVHANLAKLDKIPVDPLTEKEYTYSVISNGNEYELWWMTEGDIVSYRPPLTPPYQGGEQAAVASSPLIRGELRGVSAWTVEAQAYTTWNYNGMMAKSLTWVTCRIFSLPSIITNDTSVTDLQQLVTEQRLVYRSYKNLPSSLKESKFKNDGWFAFVPNQLLSYSDTWSCAKITENTASWTESRVTLLKWLQDSYSGTIVQSDPEIKRVVDVVIDTNSPSNEVLKLVGDLVNNNLGGKLLINSSSVSTNVSCISDSQLALINNVWKNYDIDIYSDIEKNYNINADDFATWYTKTQWCNDVKVVVINNNSALTNDLVSTYNSITNLYSVNFSWDVSANSTLLSNLNNYFYTVNRSCSWWVPNEIWSFTKIKWLLIWGCWVQIPTSISTLTNLEYLDLKQNDLSLITNELWNLTKLKTLNIQNTLLNTFPIWIGNLVWLTDLNISTNNFTSIPSSIWNLTNLVNLEINSCLNLTSIPSEIWNLTKLEFLSISDTWISNLPSTIWNLINLTSLMIDNNNSLVTIPTEIWNLVNMDTLNIRNNPNITSIPTTIWNLTNLVYLYLNDNNLNTLPSELSNLNQLINLWLEWNTSLWNLNNYFDENSSTLTQGWMTIQWNGTNIVVTWTF